MVRLYHRRKRKAPSFAAEGAVELAWAVRWRSRGERRREWGRQCAHAQGEEGRSGCREIITPIAAASRGDAMRANDRFTKSCKF